MNCYLHLNICIWFKHKLTASITQKLNFYMLPSWTIENVRLSTGDYMLFVSKPYIFTNNKFL